VAPLRCIFVLSFLRAANKQYRSTRNPREALRDASQHQTANAPASVSADYNKVGAPGCRLLFDRIINVCAEHDDAFRIEFYSCRTDGLRTVSDNLQPSASIAFRYSKIYGASTAEYAIVRSTTCKSRSIEW
jgi:hypothetical protein